MESTCRRSSGYLSGLCVFVGLVTVGCTTQGPTPKTAIEHDFPTMEARAKSPSDGGRTVFMSEAPLVGEHAKQRVFEEQEAKRHLRPFLSFIETHYGRSPTYRVRPKATAQMHEINLGADRPEFVLLYSPLRTYCAEKVGYRSIHPSSSYYRSLLFARRSEGAPTSLNDVVKLSKSRPVRMAYRPFSTSSLLAPASALAGSQIPRERVVFVKAKNKGDLLQLVASGAVDIAAIQNTLYDRLEFDGAPVISQIRPIWLSPLLPSGAFMVDEALLSRQPLANERSQPGRTAGDLIDDRHIALRTAFANLFGRTEDQNALRDVNVFRPTQSQSFVSVLGPLFEVVQAWKGEPMDWCHSDPGVTRVKDAPR